MTKPKARQIIVPARPVKRGNATAAESGRKASAALYVMLEPDRKAEYEKAADEYGVSMREWVTKALDAALARQKAGFSPEPHEQMDAVEVRKLIADAKEKMANALESERKMLDAASQAEEMFRRMTDLAKQSADLQKKQEDVRRRLDENERKLQQAERDLANATRK